MNLMLDELIFGVILNQSDDFVLSKSESLSVTKVILVSY